MKDEPLFSVVIPSRNNREKLERTLGSIADCQFDLDKVEVVVVDDGSDDGTYETFNERSFPFAFKIIRGNYANQSKATNEAIRNATGTYILSSASDIIFDQRMFQEHLSSHQRLENEDVCVLGTLPYAPELEVTPFMFYMVNGGPQFAYHLIVDTMHVPPSFLYAPNFSIKRSALERVGGFDERYPFGCQDSDLGIRMYQAGIRIVYNRNAIGFHNHPVEFKGFFRRQEMAGDAVLRLMEKHPDYMGDISLWDTALAQYMAYSGLEMDRDLIIIEKLEREILSHGDSYKTLWTRHSIEKHPTSELSESETQLFTMTMELFRAYERIVGRYWSKGYIERGVEMLGAERVKDILKARAAIGNPTIQNRRVAELRMSSYGQEVSLVQPGEIVVTVIICGCTDYRTALGMTEIMFPSGPPVQNHEFLLACKENRFNEDEKIKIEETFDLYLAEREDAAVMDAVRNSKGGIVVVMSAEARPRLNHIRVLAQQLFDRIPDLAVLGGCVIPGSDTVTAGYGADGSPIEYPAGTISNPLPVNTVVRDLCVVRGELLSSLVNQAGDAPASAWNEILCDFARQNGRSIIHVPGLESV